MRTAVERLAAHERRWLAGDAKCQQHLSRERALADGMVAVIGEPDCVVWRHEHAVGARELPFPERAQEVAVAIEDDHRMGTSIEDVDVIVLVHADAADFLE